MSIFYEIEFAKYILPYPSIRQLKSILCNVSGIQKISCCKNIYSYRFFSPYFSTATRPTQFLLTWLVIAQLALQAFPSLRFLHRTFLSQMTHRCLNRYYRALQNETVTSRSPRLQTAKLSCSLIPAALQNEPVFLSIDDMTIPKFGNKFDAVSLLHAPACHKATEKAPISCFGKQYMVVYRCLHIWMRYAKASPEDFFSGLPAIRPPYVTGHCFVSLTLSIPVLSHIEGEALFTRYPAIPARYRL